MMKNCSACGRLFTPRRSYYHQCYSCWSEIRANDAGLREGWAAGYEAGYQAGRMACRLEARSPVIAGELIMRLVRLTHPDKHPPERFAEANAVTAKLLELREAVEVRR